MRQGSQGSNGRRGRNRSNNSNNNNSSSSNNNNNNNNTRKPNQPSRNHVYESHGPEVKVRGNALQIYEKYVALARDATTASEHVKAEGLYQHGEHYLRIYNAQNPPQVKKPEDAESVDPASQDQPAMDNQRGRSNDQPLVEAPAIDADQPQPSLLDAQVPGQGTSEDQPASAQKRRPRRKKPEFGDNTEEPRVSNVRNEETPSAPERTRQRRRPEPVAVVEESKAENGGTEEISPAPERRTRRKKPEPVAATEEPKAAITQGEETSSSPETSTS
jgi:hypothetical protein